MTPVLFMVFNRPDTTRKVFAAIRSARPPRIYIAADGPRPDREDDATKCLQVRKIVSDIDWECEVKFRFQEKNLGCKLGVGSAIDWFFEQEEMGIILEDDCLPSQSFFWFCQEVLDRFKDDERVMAIGAQHFQRNFHKPEYQYYFSRYNHCWGWATWNRAWKLYDRNMQFWPYLRKTDWLRSIGNGDKLFQKFWTHIFDSAYNNLIDTWDYSWTYSCWSQSGLTILPAKNLVSNIGFDQNATHTKSTNHITADLPLEEIKFPITHPPLVVRDQEADKWSDRYVFKITYIDYIVRYVISSLKRIPGMRWLIRMVSGGSKLSKL